MTVVSVPDPRKISPRRWPAESAHEASSPIVQGTKPRVKSWAGFIKWPVLFCAMLVLAGCAEQAVQEATTNYVPILPPSDPDQESWASNGSEVVARVGAGAVKAADIQAVLNAGLAEDAESALQHAIETEALAQWALKAAPGEVHNNKTKLRFRQALVQRLLRSEFEEKLTPETVSMEYIKRAFWSPSIRKRYIHYDAFQVKDIQFVCCFSIAECNNQPETREPCFEEGRKAATELYKRLLEKPPESLAAFEAFAVEEMPKVHIKLSLHEYSFFYDVNVSYEENSKVDKFTRPVTEAVLAMKEGDIHAPVRDPFGWHIMFLINHNPEKNLRPENPEVRKEISEGIYPKVQSAELMMFLGAQLAEQQVEIKAARIEALAAQRGAEGLGDNP